ncbi:ankyrin-1-like [Uloborus diversus]|uniref:ankyrin-1-like n=1 Tax=Uloborus diversus TaxID=327109 RepID=UPI002408F34D|nr:ankyrin-1-like [Uloborus diversus]
MKLKVKNIRKVLRASSKTDSFGQSELHRAAFVGDTESVKKLLARGFNYYLRDKEGKTPLHIALLGSKKAVAELLVDGGCTRNVLDRNGSTPLHLAAYNGYDGIVKKLLEAGGDTRMPDKWGNTPVLCALNSREEASAELLVDMDVTNNIPGIDGCTPLHRAAYLGYEGVVWKLLTAGADTRVHDRRGHTPLHRALLRRMGQVHRNEAVAELLVDVDCTNDIPDFHFGKTPLHLAAGRGFIGTVRKLLFGHVHPHMKDSMGGYPLCAAFYGGHHDVVKVILEACALRDIEIDWKQVSLPKDHIRHYITLLSECEAEMQRMRVTRVHESRLSFYDVVKRHVCRVTPYLRIDSIVHVFASSFQLMLDFPHYADFIAHKLGCAKKRRALANRCVACFSLPAWKLPPLPPTVTDILFLCLSDSDMRNFICAVDGKS